MCRQHGRSIFWRLHSGLILVCFLCTSVHCGAQEDIGLIEDRWECAVGGGFLVPHRAAIRPMLEGHALLVQLNWTTPAKGTWGQCRNDARWGASLRMGSTGSPTFLGMQAALLGVADLRLVSSWRFRLGGGLGWTQKTWGANTPDARQRVVIGSPFNVAVQVGLHRPGRFDSGSLWHQRIGLHWTFDHQSNASFTQPNLGTNVAAMAASIPLKGMHATRVRIQKDTRSPSALPNSPMLKLRFHAAMGRRQSAPLSSRETIAETGLDLYLGRGLRTGLILGSHIFWRPEDWGLGIHGGFQLRFAKVNIDLVHGRYASRWQTEEGHYNRVVVHAHWRGGWWFNLGLLTHGFRAHHPLLGIGFLPRWSQW